MSRQARKKSATGIYHVMLRGIDKRNIFFDEQDYKKFIQYMGCVKSGGGFDLYAYCLMSNHVHLLMKEEEEIGNSVKRIAIRYAAWHSRKYERTGHLFQNRYISEPVENDSYFITVARYILRNPVKAGVVVKAEEYPWSSYHQYSKALQGKETLIDSKLIMGYFHSPEEFFKYVNSPNDDKCIDYDSGMKYNDDVLKEIIAVKYDIKKLHELSVQERGKVIQNIYNETHASIRQLSRVLGVTRSIVQEASKKWG